MLLPKARGELSEGVFAWMQNRPRPQLPHLAPSDDEDAAITLWALYELHYRGFEDVDDELEWDPDLLTLRRSLERELEGRLRSRWSGPPEYDGAFPDALLRYAETHDGPSVARFVQTEATRDQVLELLRLRSIYHLKEADPTVWVIPRLPVSAKAATVELQFDEYGGGDPEALHAQLFARGLEATGLDPAYGAYIDDVPLQILEQNNAMSLFGLHRRLRGAALGHLTAFEATSSLPCRKMAQGMERLGLPPEMIGYYTEHIEADAVHEQLAARTICGALVAEEPETEADVWFGAFTCLDLEARTGEWILGRWAA